MPLCETARPSFAPATRPARLVTGLLTSLVVAGASVALAGPAAAESRVTITDDSGASVTEVVVGSVVHVSGAGFQSVQGGAGGIYVTFGWVDDAAGGSWRPSEGGSTGVDYLYAPDVEGAENQGFQRYVAFPGSSTEAAANGGVIAADGTWTTDLTIPAVQFEAMDREGNPAPVDCAQVQCGFITVGAHGVKNTNNETFTPVTFIEAAAAEPAPSEEATVATPAETTDTTSQAPDDATATTADASTSDEVDETITAISAGPGDSAADSSAQRTFIASMIGGFLTIALLVYLGVRRTRSRRAATGEPTTDSPPDDDATR